MTRLIAYLCNNDSLTPVAVQALSETIEIPDTSSSGGFGFGWVQDGRSLLRTTPKPSAGSPDFLRLMSDIPSRAILGNARDGDAATAAALDLQPFRFRQWVCAHDGELPEVEWAHEELLAEVPGFIRSNVKGDSASEVLCHVFLGELHQRDLLQNARTNPRGTAEAMAVTMQRLQAEAAVARFAGIGVTERGLVAGCFGEPLFYREVRGLKEQREMPLFAGHQPKPIDHPSFKAVVVSNVPADGAAGWHEIGDGQVLYVEDWSVKFVDSCDV